MKQLLSFLSVLILSSVSMIVMAEDFSAVNSDGKIIYYKITSSTSPNYEVGVSYMGTSPFLYDEYIGIVNIPSSVTYNGITYSVTSIGASAFQRCTGLTSATIPNSVTSIGEYAFHGCTSLTSITIPNSVISIGEAAFYPCSSLTTITIPNSVISIGDLAFYYCTGLTSISIPNSVNLIGDRAFGYCTSLTSITCKRTPPPTIDNLTFYGTPNNIPLIVCDTSAYQIASYWSSFTNVILGTNTYNTEATICQGETYNFNGQILTTSGTYADTLQVVNSCDSIVTLNLIVNELSNPTNLTLDNIQNYFELSWQGNGLNYIIYRDDDSVFSTTNTIYRDSNVVDGVNYCYKVKALSGECEVESVEVCQVFLGLNDIETSNNIILYPNPVNNFTTLSIENLKEKADIIIYDINGKKIKTYTMNSNQKQLMIDVSEFAKGIYNVKIITQSLSINKKMIVQ